MPDIHQKPPKECREQFTVGDRCPVCAEASPPWHPIGYWKRQLTSYPKEADNWQFLCEYCHEENDEYWKEMREDYNNMIREGLFSNL